MVVAWILGLVLLPDIYLFRSYSEVSSDQPYALELYLPQHMGTQFEIIWISSHMNSLMGCCRSWFIVPNIGHSIDRFQPNKFLDIFQISQKAIFIESEAIVYSDSRLITPSVLRFLGRQLVTLF